MTVVVSDTSQSEEAKTKEEAGAYEQATDLHFQSAGTRISSYLWAPDEDPSSGNLVLADLLRAVYCARRADDTARAENLALVYEGVAGIVRTTTNLERVPGLVTELLGDCHLLLEQQDAVEYYERAASQYESLDEIEQLSWGMEPEFVHAQWVVDDYLEWIGLDLEDQFGIDTSISTVLSEDFSKRIEVKCEISRSVPDD